MIQRPQTLFLLFAALLNFAAFFNSIYSNAMADPAEWIGYGFASSLTLSMVIALGSIFFYKNRPLQLRIVKAGTYIQIIALGFAIGVLFSSGGFGIFLWQETIGVGFVMVSLALYWLAGRSIKKDEELVQSMDRIR